MLFSVCRNVSPPPSNKSFGSAGMQIVTWRFVIPSLSCGDRHTSDRPVGGRHKKMGSRVER
eukprot:30870-Pelagococcus_subviridis.AAC.1